VMIIPWSLSVLRNSNLQKQVNPKDVTAVELDRKVIAKLFPSKKKVVATGDKYNLYKTRIT
jgi:hypothetical protein